jgi:hypothetical protein
LRLYVQEAIDLFQQHVNLFIVEPFPPGPHDPQGICGAIWEACCGEKLVLCADKPLTLASYEVKPNLACYVEPLAVCDRLLDMPLFLRRDHYVLVPLEETYEAVWNKLPAEIRGFVDPGENQ